MGYVVVVVIGLVLCMPFSSRAASKSMCQDKVFETKTVDGVYQGNECGDFCYSSVRLDSGEDFAFLCSEDLAKKLFGVSVGQRVSVTYEVQQFWNEFGNECTRTEVCKSGNVIAKTSGVDTVQSDNISNSKNIFINNIKGGVLSFDKTATIGGAFDGYKYFDQKKWSAFEDSQKRSIVEFKGDYDLKYLYDHPNVSENFENYIDQYRKDLSLVKNIQFVVQFLIEKDKKSFEVGYVGLEYHLKNSSKTIHQKINDMSCVVAIYNNVHFLSLMNVAFAVEGQK